MTLLFFSACNFNSNLVATSSSHGKEGVSQNSPQDSPEEEPQMWNYEDFAMGTVITQKVYGVNVQEIMEEVMEELANLEALLTFNAPGGDVNKLNENAGKNSVELNPHTIAILNKSQEVAEVSGGAFDVTVGPLVKAWGIGTEQPQLLEESDLEELLPLINYRDLIIEGNKAFLKNEGQMVDLGGIAKGYAGDIAAEIYRSHGIDSAFINLGGNVVTIGSKPDGSPWAVGINDPRSPIAEKMSNNRDYHVGAVTVVNKSVVTAGDDQRYFLYEGERFHHILDPHTGYPAQSDLMSVTLITETSLEADALDTAAYILGLEQGMEMLKKYGSVEAVFITKDKKIYVTEGIKEDFHFLDETGEYEYIEN
ncbi:MAG: FAD:protein FMN transferase [Desulfitobacterium sp.]|nr:FAD:protein FMN transferase [Desulfitobacterium sp.]